MTSTERTLTLTVETRGAVALEVEGRRVVPVPVDSLGTASVQLSAPWPADLRLRARAADGSRSAPLRVRIESGE